MLLDLNIAFDMPTHDVLLFNTVGTRTNTVGTRTNRLSVRHGAPGIGHALTDQVVFGRALSDRESRLTAVCPSPIISTSVCPKVRSWD